MKVPFSYLKEKFANPDAIWNRMRETVSAGDFTVSVDRKSGREVGEFEQTFANMMGVKHAIGVANGTDALELSLWALGVRARDEVIAPANTFVASLGAIGNLQAVPKLVDIGPDYVIDASQIEKNITRFTKAIMPVHFTGQPCDMDEIMHVANKHGIPVVEDACQSFLAEYKGKCVGSIGHAGAFSLHPLKILNVWGDGGVVTTNDDRLAEEIRLHQNHGMQTRDNITRFPCRNSRLDAIHAAVANYQLPETPAGVEKRRANAEYYDEQLRAIDGVHIMDRKEHAKSVFHLYFIEVDAELRPGLYKYLQSCGIEPKIHYEVPLYLQPGLLGLGYRRGDFPVADRLCDRILTLKVDECTTREQQDHVIASIRQYMMGRRSW